MSEEEKGLRYNQGKMPWRLLPWDALREIVKVSLFGMSPTKANGSPRKAYPARNWEKGLDYDEVYDSAMRHLTDWYLGEDTNEESGLHHLSHAAWNILALLAFELRGMKSFDTIAARKRNRETHPR